MGSDAAVKLSRSSKALGKFFSGAASAVTSFARDTQSVPAAAAAAGPGRANDPPGPLAPPSAGVARVLRLLQRDLEAPDAAEGAELAGRLWAAACWVEGRDVAFEGFGRPSPVWRALGFVAPDGVADLAKSGNLGLRSLVYFVETHERKVRSPLRAPRRAPRPAEASVSATFVCASNSTLTSPLGVVRVRVHRRFAWHWRTAHRRTPTTRSASWALT